MKKILIIIATMMSLSIHAEGEGRHAMHAFYFMDVTNPIAVVGALDEFAASECCLLYTSPSPRDRQKSRMPSSA